MKDYLKSMRGPLVVAVIIISLFIIGIIPDDKSQNSDFTGDSSKIDCQTPKTNDNMISPNVSPNRFAFGDDAELQYYEDNYDDHFADPEDIITYPDEIFDFNND